MAADSVAVPEVRGSDPQAAFINGKSRAPISFSHLNILSSHNPTPFIGARISACKANFARFLLIFYSFVGFWYMAFDITAQVC